MDGTTENFSCIFCSPYILVGRILKSSGTISVHFYCSMPNNFNYNGTAMLWVKAFHIIAMVTWFAGLFYLPRLFVYHASSSDEISNQRFKIMERKLYFGIATPGAIITIILGFWLTHLMGYTIFSCLLVPGKISAGCVTDCLPLLLRKITTGF